MEQNIIEYNKGREVIYSVFSNIFINTLDENMYKILKDIVPFLATFKEDTENQLLSQGVEGIISFIKEYETSNNREAFVDETSRQYTRLFCLGNGAELSESVYLSAEHLVDQDDSIITVYKSCNFKMDEKYNEPQDHLSYELMFMSFLSKGIANKYTTDTNSVRQFLQIQKDFLEEHIMQWSRLFIERLLNFPESYKFYLPAAYFITGFMQEDYEYIKDELK